MLLFLVCVFVYVFFFLMIRRPPRSTRTDTLFPDTTLFRSNDACCGATWVSLQARGYIPVNAPPSRPHRASASRSRRPRPARRRGARGVSGGGVGGADRPRDRARLGRGQLARRGQGRDQHWERGEPGGGQGGTLLREGAGGE